jgi:hypothetical protein
MYVRRGGYRIAQVNAMNDADQTQMLTSVVGRMAPHLRIVSVSNPEPHMERLNVIATTSDLSTARAAVLELEAEELDDARIGLVALGAPTAERDEPVGVDPERVGRTLVPRIVTGAAVGAVAGAGIGVAITAISGAPGSYVVGAALGGAALFAVPGAIWATFPRMGGSDAYRQTFVDESIDELNVVSLHTTDDDEAVRAINRLQARPGLVVRLLDAHGEPVPPAERF